MKEWSLARQFELKCEKKYINEMTSFIKAREDYEDRIKELNEKAETQRILFADAVEEADLYKNKNLSSLDELTQGDIFGVSGSKNTNSSASCDVPNK